MALPSSGAISLNDVNVEIGNSGTATITMNDADVRTLFDDASGQISMSQGHGKAWTIATTATGGTITTSGNYKIHTFTSSGTFQVTAGNQLTNGFEILTVAGGASGGAGVGGGGGAGGMVHQTNVTGSITSYTVTVGGGGAARANNEGNAGSNSSVSSIGTTCIGGGAGGGTHSGGSLGQGNSGGSGGGNGNMSS